MIGHITQNPTLDCALLAWFLAQIMKVVLTLLLEQRLDLRLMAASGGMPSSH